MNEKYRKRNFFKWLVFVFFLVLVFCFFFEVNIRPRRNFYGKQVKKTVLSIKDKFYQQATKHNPKGDVWPDWIDDLLKLETKQFWYFLVNFFDKKQEKVDK